MLEELKNLNIPCGKKEFLYFFESVMGTHSLSKKDISVLFQHAPSGMKFDTNAMLTYCKSFLWIVGSTRFQTNEVLLEYLGKSEILNNKLIELTVNGLFEAKLMGEESFSFSPEHRLYRFRHETFSLKYSAVRDVLVSQGFMSIQRKDNGNVFYIAPQYQWLIAKHLRSNRVKIKLDEFKKRLEANELAGAKAEEFVITFEEKRLLPSQSSKICHVSEIDVSAGYDIASFEDVNSVEYDNFIEVKAISSQGDFYWSKNEYETAQLLGRRYKLYLVDLSKIGDPSYAPEIIVDPAQEVMLSDAWMAETQSYHIKRIINED